MSTAKCSHFNNQTDFGLEWPKGKRRRLPCHTQSHSHSFALQLLSLNHQAQAKEQILERSENTPQPNTLSAVRKRKRDQLQSTYNSKRARIESKVFDAVQKHAKQVARKRKLGETSVAAQDEEKLYSKREVEQFIHEAMITHRAEIIESFVDTFMERLEDETKAQHEKYLQEQFLADTERKNDRDLFSYIS